MYILEFLYYFIVIPGFLFTAFVGLLSTWIDRKVTARIQWRQGPPLYQPFADMLKLLGKQTFVPRGASGIIFVLAPLLAILAVNSAAFMLWNLNFNHFSAFAGDIAVIILLLAAPSIATMAGGSITKNPLAALGVNRERRLLLSYGLPLMLATTIVMTKSGSITLGGILGYQASHGIILGSFSGIIAFLIILFISQALLGFAPFDTTEAEQEIESGPMLEYSGRLLACFKLIKAMMFFILPMFLITLFMGGLGISTWKEVLSFIIKYAVALFLMILIKNTNPRVRIDQAVNFFLIPLTVLGIAGVILAMIGL